MLSAASHHSGIQDWEEEGNWASDLSSSTSCTQGVYFLTIFLPTTALREISQQLVIPQYHFPKLLMKQVLKAEQIPETTFFFSFFPLLHSCFVSRSPDHLPPVPTREVCPVCLELHHVQWGGRVHLPEQPMRLPMRGGVPTVQLPHHRHPDHGVHSSQHGQDLDRSL